MKTLFTFLLSLLLLAGCRKSEFDTPGIPGDVKLSINFGKYQDGSISSFSQVPGGVSAFSLAQDGANSDAISDLNLFIFDPSGNLLNQSYYTSVGSGVNINTTSGQRNICAVANYGTQITGITKLSDLTALIASAPTPSAMVNANKNFIMSKQTGQITIPAPSTPGGTVTMDPILLDRLTAKVTVTFDKSGLNSDVTITPLKIAVRQVANSCSLFAANIPTATSQIAFNGDSLVNNSGIVSTSHSTAVPLYLYENVQGANGTTTDQTQKTPASGKDKLCSYLEITANYSSPDQNGTVVYRYWLGVNTVTNFSIVRNTWYQISIAYHGTGAVTENTWRVNVAGLSDVFMPTALNFPWYGGRTQIYNLSTAYATTTLGNLLQNAPSATIKDSIVYVMTKQDNVGNTPLVMGNITGKTTYNLSQRYRGNLEFFVDVSLLTFPKNSTFGSTNYPITKYISIYSKGNDVGTWRVRCSADWLFIGNGATFQSFTASGSPATGGTVGMLNRTGGALQSTPTMTSVAVRATDNTTNQPRMAYIVFYSQTGQELARVFVSQNPSSFPKAATGLTYIPGGVFKPGAFASNGNPVSNGPANTSTKEVWVRITPFYLTKTEGTVQEFCDYLNDLGVTSSAPMVGGLLGTLLGGGGSIADYPGGTGLLNVLLGSMPVFSGSTGPTLTSGKWVPATASVAINGTSATNVTAPIPNYPMQNITFYGAYDYGYWLNKFSDRSGVTRAGTYGLPTEMEWEAAARGISNGLTTKDAFDNSSNTSKNGVYPYPMPLPNLNIGFTGKEVGEVVGIKSIIWYTGSNWNRSTGAATLGSSYVHPTGNLVPNSIALYDMGGNVGEWNVDTYNGAIDLSLTEGSLVTVSVYLTNLGGLLVAADRMVRGGDNTGAATTCGVAYRQHFAPSTTSPTIGLRAVIH